MGQPLWPLTSFPGIFANNHGHMLSNPQFLICKMGLMTAAASWDWCGETRAWRIGTCCPSGASIHRSTHSSNYSLFLALSRPAPAEPSLSLALLPAAGWWRRRGVALSPVGGGAPAGARPKPRLLLCPSAAGGGGMKAKNGLTSALKAWGPQLACYWTWCCSWALPPLPYFYFKTWK